MRILLLSFFFKPDISPAAFRMNALIEQFKDVCPNEYEVEFITTFPNRYSSFQVDVPELEYYGNIKVKRIKLPFVTRGKKYEVFNYTYYFFTVLRKVMFKKYDLVFVTSSKVFTGVLGSIVSRIKGIPFYLDTRDMFVEALENNSESKVFKKFFVPVLKRLMQFQYKTAKRVNLLSEGFIPLLKNYKVNNPSFLTNGIDEVFIKKLHNNGYHKTLSNGRRKRITYAGHIGLAYALHTFIPYAAKELPDYEFVIIGDGFLKYLLVDKIKELGVDNVILKDPMGRNELCEEYEKSDFLLLTTKKIPIYETVISTKVFDYGATNKPILAGVKGFSRRFMEENIPGVLYFEPSDWKQMVEQIRTFEYETYNRDKFREEYAFSNIMQKMSKDILSLID